MRVNKNQLLHVMENVFSPQISGYRKSYNSKHVLISLIEEWSEYLHRLYSRRSFDTLVKSLLLHCAKLEAYGLGKKALSYTHSYLANRNQRVGINDTKSDFQKIISGVPQGSEADLGLLQHPRWGAL